MPVGKELGSFDAKITSIRICEVNGDDRVIEGTYEAEVSGQLSGTATGTMTFTGSNDSGSFTDLGVGYLDSGDALSGKGQGVYWLTKPGEWEIRGAFTLGTQRVVSEGRIELASRSMRGKILELT